MATTKDVAEELATEPRIQHLIDLLVQEGVPDALMLRRVMRLRELAKELDAELAALQAYFTADVGDHTPPS